MTGHARRHSAVSFAKIAEQIEMPFELWTRVGPRKHFPSLAGMQWLRRILYGWCKTQLGKVVRTSTVGVKWRKTVKKILEKVNDAILCRPRPKYLITMSYTMMYR